MKEFIIFLMDMKKQSLKKHDNKPSVLDKKLTEDNL